MLAAIYFVLIYRLFCGKVRIEDDGFTALPRRLKPRSGGLSTPLSSRF
jgi:hypothetical protein